MEEDNKMRDGPEVFESFEYQNSKGKIWLRGQVGAHATSGGSTRPQER